MTLTIHPYFLYYWLFAIVFCSVHNFIELRTGLRKLKTEEKFAQLRTIFDHFKQQASMQFLWKQIVNPFSISVAYLIFCIVTPVLLPRTLFKLGKKATGYKTKLEKKAEQETKDMEEAKKRSEEFMRTENMFADEGNMHIVIDDIITPPKNDIEPNAN
jgi:hypothetical protein